jgi:c-di-GMP-binding flagellar brake protein YcgR
METNNRNTKRQIMEKRKCKRFNVFHLDLPVEIKLENENLTVPGILLDISTTNIGLLSFKEIKPNTILSFSLNLHNIKTGSIKAKVIWVKEMGNTYRLGLEFIDISQNDIKNISNFIEEYIKEDF